MCVLYFVIISIDDELPMCVENLDLYFPPVPQPTCILTLPVLINMTGSATNFFFTRDGPRDVDLIIAFGIL